MIVRVGVGVGSVEGFVSGRITIPEAIVGIEGNKQALEGESDKSGAGHDRAMFFVNCPTHFTYIFN